jgi:GT2 family glycosyltransferase
MSFVPGGGARVTIGLVALGIKDRLPGALEAFRAHRSRVDFDIVCVINAVDDDDPALATLPSDVTVVTRRANLGYVGGLHLARAYARGEFMVWGQDDMTPTDGWLDALVDAADASAGIAVVGSRQVDASDNTHPLNSGRTPPGEPVGTWPSHPDAVEPPGAAPFATGWVSGAGSLARLTVWDEVGGVDVRLWPLNFVDLAFSVHVRAHGHQVVHAPGACIVHLKRGSTSTLLVGYTAVRNTELLDADGWPGVTAQLGETDVCIVDHPCAPWRGAGIAEIEALQTEEASRAFIPLANHYGDFWESTNVRVAEYRSRIAVLEEVLEEVLASTSWRVTAPLRGVSGVARRVLRRG